MTSPRGILSQPGKKGKLKDAFFSDVITTDKDLLDRVNSLNNEEKEEFFKKVNSRKKGNQKAADRPNFKPTSPTEYID